MSVLGPQCRQERSRLADGRSFDLPDVHPRMGSLTLVGDLDFAPFFLKRFVVVAARSMSFVIVLHLVYAVAVIAEFRLQWHPEIITPLRLPILLPRNHAAFLLQVAPDLSAVLGNPAKGL